MARGAIVAQTFPLSVGPQYYPATPLSAGTAALTMTTGNSSDGHVATIVDGKTVVLAFNSDTMTARTITISSVTDSLSRKGDITAYSLAVGDICTFGPFKQLGWNQSSPAGLWIDVSNAAVLLAVITLPSTGN
jgi:hypothetical protein